MKIIADLHCHTIASAHAYSTVMEYINEAKKKDLKAVAITDHGPKLPDSPHNLHFLNLDAIPHVVDGITVLYGVEADISDYDGKLDIDENILKRLDWVIASFHTPACPPADEKTITKAYLGVAKNPLVDCIGHSGLDDYKYDYEKVIPVFKEYEKVVELNEGTYRVRKQSVKNCYEIAKLCKKFEVPVVVNSDAHFASCIGEFDNVVKMLKEIDFPEKLILNADEQRLYSYIHKKRGINFNDIIKNLKGTGMDD